MYHFFESITNTKGDALTGYYVRVTNNGVGVSLYADTNSTPIISVSGVADAAKVDADGNADFYCDVGTYQLDIYATDGTTLVKSIHDVGMNIDVDTAALAEAAQVAASASATAAAISADQAAGYFNSIAATTTDALNRMAGTRTAMAALATDRPVILTEPGREGTFVFSSANLSTQVAADPQQAVYVAPASDTTGASGAWVRKRESDHLHVDWFGAVADGVTDNTAAFVALRTVAGALATDAANGLRRAPKIRLGRGTYLLASSFDCKGFTGDWEGASSGGFAGWNNTGGTTIKMASGCTWYFQRSNTEGGSTGTTIPYGCDGSSFRNITWQGPGQGVGTASIARMRAKVSISNCRFIAGGGYGLEISATAGGGTTLEGNANGWSLTGCASYNNGNSGLGVGVNGASADVNAGVAVNCDFSSNSEFGLYDNSFLGNSYVGCHSASNGSSSSYANYGGNWYSVVAGQEAGASTNAPSGTSADNAWWYYGGSGSATVARTWTSGLTWIAGGAYRTQNANAGNVLVGCYSESGQGPSQLSSQTLWSGGMNAAGTKGGTVIGGYLGNLTSYAGGFRGYYPSTLYEVKFGAASGDIVAVTGNGYTNTAYWRQAGADLYHQIGNIATDRDGLWTGVNTTWQLGTGASVGYGVHAFSKLAIGNGTYDFNQARRHMTMTAAPTTGAWAQGDVVYNQAPTAGGKLGWVCTTAGSPGTWKAFGVIDA